MAPAAHGMAFAWEHGVSAKAPSAPIVSNLTASLITTPERLKGDIVASIHKPVLWASALDVMKNEGGVTRFVYIGPGRALANLANKELKNGRWKDSKEDIEIIPVATMKDFEECAEECQDLIKQGDKKAQLQAATL
jgi:malonyl CoA-acyl carrier protein transacylase